MTFRIHSAVGFISILLFACGGVTDSSPDASGVADGSPDGSVDSADAAPGDPDSAVIRDAEIPLDAPPAAVCSPDEVLRCEADDLVICNEDGSAEHDVTCALGCDDTGPRCRDVDPSNDLAGFLDEADQEPVADLGDSATINTDTGQVEVDGVPVAITSFVTGDEPEVRVFAVGGFVTNDVTLSGDRALAVVSDGDVEIRGHVSLSASGSTGGPGAFDTPSCVGEEGEKNSPPGVVSYGGGGGGGFGSEGGSGGLGIADDDGEDVRAEGGAGGGTAGNEELLPLRGGCSGVGAETIGGPAGGGGAVQLVSRTKITVDGILEANGAGGRGGGEGSGGGGSGGGILLEAPQVTINGNVVANGGGGGAGTGFCGEDGDDGRTDDERAPGGEGCGTATGDGGLGAAESLSATNGQN